MDKLNQHNIFASIAKQGTVTKITDEKFNDQHPGSINTGYTQTGFYLREPTVGERFNLGTLSTSMVTELLEDGKFRTLNSVYQLVEEVK